MVQAYFQQVWRKTVATYFGMKIDLEPKCTPNITRCMKWCKINYCIFFIFPIEFHTLIMTFVRNHHKVGDRNTCTDWSFRPSSIDKADNSGGPLKHHALFTRVRNHGPYWNTGVDCRRHCLFAMFYNRGLCALNICKTMTPYHIINILTLLKGKWYLSYNHGMIWKYYTFLPLCIHVIQMPYSGTSIQSFTRMTRKKEYRE